MISGRICRAVPLTGGMMTLTDDLERARDLAHQALSLCDRAGAGIAAGHLQLAIDRIEQHGTQRAKRPAASWAYIDSFIAAPPPEGS